MVREKAQPIQLMPALNGRVFIEKSIPASGYARTWSYKRINSRSRDR